MKRNQRDCVNQTKKFNDSSFFINTGNVRFIIIEIENADEMSSDDEKMIIMNHIFNVFVSALFAAAVQKPEKTAAKIVKNVMKKIFDKQIEKKKNFFRFKTLRSEK